MRKESPIGSSYLSARFWVSFFLAWLIPDIVAIGSPFLLDHGRFDGMMTEDADVFGPTHGRRCAPVVIMIPVDHKGG